MTRPGLAPSACYAWPVPTLKWSGRLWILLMLLSAGGVVARDAAAQAAPSRAHVRGLLSGIEHVPTDADWRRLGDGALPVLIDLFNSPAEPAFVRLRALGATGAFPRPAVRTFLLAAARVEHQHDLLVREAVVTLARAFGAAAVRDLLPFLSHPEVVVRDATARSLGRIGGAQAIRALRARLALEHDEGVRSSIEGALRR